MKVSVWLSGNNILKLFDPDLGRNLVEDDVRPVDEVSVTVKAQQKVHHILKVKGLSGRKQKCLDELEMGIFAKS